MEKLYSLPLSSSGIDVLYGNTSKVVTFTRGLSREELVQLQHSVLASSEELHDAAVNLYDECKHSLRMSLRKLSSMTSSAFVAQSPLYMEISCSLLSQGGLSGIRG